VDDIGNIVRLEVSVGRVTQIATSVEQFLSMAGTESKQQEWFAKEDAMQFAKKGLIPNQEQCIAFKIPVVFSECANTTNNAYVGNLYEYVSYLGSIHRQIAELPDGSKIKLRIQPERPPE
jgi:hypothetical protein